MVNCVVDGCRRRSGTSNMKNDGVSYHTFPRDPVVKEKWRVFCGHNLEKWRPTRNSVICSDHFTSNCFEVNTNLRRKLLEGAVPTIRRILSVVGIHPEIEFQEVPPPSTNGKKPVQNLTPREIKMKLQLQYRQRKIRLLQERNRYLKKKVNTLQELLDDLLF